MGSCIFGFASVWLLERSCLLGSKERTDGWYLDAGCVEFSQQIGSWAEYCEEGSGTHFLHVGLAY